MTKAKEKSLSFGEPFNAFGDGEICHCRKIQPADLCHFHPRDCALRNNRFLQYGFYNFGHLLIGKTVPDITYWECPEAMTSRNDLWQICLVSRILKKADRSSFLKAGRILVPFNQSPKVLLKEWSASESGGNVPAPYKRSC